MLKKQTLHAIDVLFTLKKNTFILVSCLLSVNTVCSLAGKALDFCHTTFCFALEHISYLFKEFGKCRHFILNDFLKRET